MSRRGEQALALARPCPGAVAALAATMLYVRYRADPALLYHARQPAYFRDTSWTAAAGTAPGGVAQLLGDRMGQCLLQPWPGAAMLAAMVGLCWLGAALAVRLLSGRRGGWLAALPAAFLLAALQEGYRLPMGAAVAALAALMFLVLYLAVRPHLGPAGRAGAGIGLAAAALPVAGGTCAGLLACCAVAELAARPLRLQVPAAQVAGGMALICALARYVYALPCRAALNATVYGPGLDAAGAAGWLVYVSTGGLVLAAALQQRLGRVRHAPDADGGGRAPLVPAPAAALVLAAAAILVVWRGLDTDRRAVLRLSRLAEQQRWAEVLQQAAGLRAYAPETVCHLRRALYHQGQLLERLFAYPVIPGEGVFDASPDNLDRLVPLADLFFELGLVNGAEQMAHEALEVYGVRPSLLQRLFLINMAKNRPAAARVFLSRLERSPALGHQAAAYRRALERDSALAEDPAVARARALAPDTDYVGYEFAAEPTLLYLLRHEPGNRMAFEYLLAHYLLTGRPGKVTAGLGRLDEWPEAYPRPLIPRHCEEALLVHAAQAGSQAGGVAALLPPGRSIRQQTLAAFARFTQIAAAHRGGRAGLRTALAADLRNTFWYYYAMGAPVQKMAGTAAP